VDHVIIDGAGALANRWAWLLKGAVSIIPPALHTRLVIRGVAATLGISPGDELASFATGMCAVPPAVFRRAFCQAQDVRISDDLVRVAAPTLLVAGECDPHMTRRSNATLAALLPGAEARFLPGVGHGWMATHPQLHAEMIRAWINGQQLPGELQRETAIPAERLVD
jgi:pimeloyl-ACP methyl ester carboxylesterase